MLGVWGQSETSVKDQGSHDVASEYGAQRPRCTGTERVQTQLLLYTLV